MTGCFGFVRAKLLLSLGRQMAFYETKPIPGAVDTAPGMPFCETEPILAWNGFVRAKTLACIQLSEILGAEPLARMSPVLRYCAGWCRGILRNRANPRSGPLYGALTSGVSVAGGWIAGFGVVPGLAVVSVSCGWKNK